MDTMVIGVAGGTGSGKSSIAKKLYEAFSPDAVILCHDYDYKHNASLTFEERANCNYDHPDSLETELMVEHIKQLKAGKDIMHPTYDFSKHLRNPVWQKLEAKRIIIVEGILIFSDKEVCSLCDLKLFVDTDADVRFARRLKRDVNKRGRTVESVIKQYMETVKPMHEQFVEPSKRQANLIIPEGAKNAIALETVIDAIKKKML